MKGKLEADFSEFKDEVDASNAKLRELEAEADKAGAAIDKATTPSGTAGAGLEGLARGLEDVGARASTTATSIGGLAKSSADLAEYGVQVVKTTEMEAAGFDTLTTATTKSIGSLASMATANAVMQAGMAGWDLGRKIAEFFDLDRKIGDVTASLLGWGDASVGAANATDTMARASALAQREVTNLDEAIKILTQHEADRTAALSRATAADQTTRAFQGWAIEIDKIVSSGALPALNRDIDSHAFSMGELAKKYGVSTAALQEYRREQEAEAAFQKETAKFTEDFLKRQADAEKKAKDEKKKQQDEEDKIRAAARAIEVNQFLERSRNILGLSAIENAATQKELENIAKRIEAHDKLAEVLRKEVAAAEASNAARTGGGGENVGLDAAQRRDAELNRISGLGAQTGVNVGPLIEKTWRDFDAMVIKASGAFDAASRPAGYGTSRFVNGRDTWGVQTTSSAAAPVVNMNVSGVWDPSTVRQMTDAVSNELMRRTGQDRYLPAR